MRLSIPLFSVCLVLVAASSLAGASRANAAPAAGPIAGPGSDPVGVHNGQPADMCAWPTAVAVSSNGALCTGTLVHPRVVIYAAHCGGGSKKILFGRSIEAPFKTIDTTKCLTNPGYGGVNDQEHDWAFCVLAQDIEELPVTPIVYGCETEIITEGRDVAVVGFGITEQNGDAGIKNWGITPIHNVYNGAVDVGGGSDPGICPGDSGGPAFVQYPDGSWHVFGIASTLTGMCGGLGTHSLAWNAVPWIEQESGFDVTPCHDVDGTWDPSFRCDKFYAAEAGVGYGEFGSWCEGTPANPASKTCGGAFNEQPDNSPPSVTITTPMSASYPDQTSFETSIEIDAQDGDGWGVVEVRLKINGDEQPKGDKYLPYQFAGVKFPEGVYELVAVAEDAAGLIAESQPVVLEIGMPPPPPGTTSGEETGAPEETGTPGETGSGPGETGGDTPTTGGSPTSDSNDSPATTLTTLPPSTGLPMDEEDSGCGCRSQPPASAAPWLLMLMIGGIRRQRAAR